MSSYTCFIENVHTAQLEGLAGVLELHLVKVARCIFLHVRISGSSTNCLCYSKANSCYRNVHNCTVEGLSEML